MEKHCFKKLQELRIKKGYTYQQMADKLNISKCFYWQIENRDRNLTYKMAFKIAKILNTKPDKIFLDEIKEDMR
ncbi:MAG TPA: helix-turn-helix transcriptional regulator [Candidatus Faecisoma merdavium]|nr:helix-turn-helix transcriptional regulator [Candidatus Faecisoma merdavium]